MDFALLGWPAEGPTLSLDHREFSYAGKFVMSSTGKLVARDEASDEAGEDGPGDAKADDDEADDENGIVGATAFDEDRTDGDVLRIRYVTVRDDRRGEGIGTALLERTREAAFDRGYGTVRIAVNNPFAYEAAYRAGFGYTGESTGIAELVLDAPRPDADRYHEGMAAFAERDVDLSADERSFVERKLDADPPES